MAQRNNAAANVAFGGVMAAMALVVMSLGGLIPVATFLCPLLCMMLLALVLRRCGSRIAWAWYGAVAILAALLGPDKEAAAVFVFLGYYPIIKPRMDGMKLRLLWKMLLFNAVILVMYSLLIYLLGMDALAEEFREAGMVLTAVNLLLGNLTFFLMDRLLALRFHIGG